MPNSIITGAELQNFKVAEFQIRASHLAAFELHAAIQYPQVERVPIIESGIKRVEDHSPAEFDRRFRQNQRVAAVGEVNFFNVEEEIRVLDAAPGNRESDVWTLIESQSVIRIAVYIAVISKIPPGAAIIRVISQATREKIVATIRPEGVVQIITNNFILVRRSGYALNSVQQVSLGVSESAGSICKIDFYSLTRIFIVSDIDAGLSKQIIRTCAAKQLIISIASIQKIVPNPRFYGVVSTKSKQEVTN